jgi:hypothetical protein
MAYTSGTRAIPVSTKTPIGALAAIADYLRVGMSIHGIIGLLTKMEILPTMKMAMLCVAPTTTNTDGGNK